MKHKHKIMLPNVDILYELRSIPVGATYSNGQKTIENLILHEVSNLSDLNSSQIEMMESHSFIEYPGITYYNVSKVPQCRNCRSLHKGSGTRNLPTYNNCDIGDECPAHKYEFFYGPDVEKFAMDYMRIIYSKPDNDKIVNIQHPDLEGVSKLDDINTNTKMNAFLMKNPWTKMSPEDGSMDYKNHLIDQQKGFPETRAAIQMIMDVENYTFPKKGGLGKETLLAKIKTIYGEEGTTEYLVKMARKYNKEAIIYEEAEEEAYVEDYENDNSDSESGYDL
jgi:hypothetical protein